MGGNIRDFEGNIAATQILDPVVLTADTDCASVDMKGYSSVAFYALVGESGDTLDVNNYIELNVEVSTDDSTFADAPADSVTNSAGGAATGNFALIRAATGDDTLYVTQYRGGVRYVRVEIDVTGTHTNGTPIAVLALRSKAHDLGV